MLATLAVFTGLIILVWSSEKFVDGAAAIAENFGISKLMIGLTIVAFGTSAPEILVSTIASFEGISGLAVGNALGSNIANIGLVLGVTAMVVAIPVHKLTSSQDLPIYLVVCLLTAWVLHDNYLGPLDTLILFAALVVIVTLVIRVRSKVKDPVLVEELREEAAVHHDSNRRALIEFVFGLLFLLLGSRLLVWGAKEIAVGFGISDVVIGLTIVAIGTSLPELAASLMSALKKHHDLAIGNVLGSNILNLLAVLPLPGIIDEGSLEVSVFERDFSVMMGMSLLMALFVFFPKGVGLDGREDQVTIGRTKGIILLLAYSAYLFSLVRSSLVVV